MASTPAIHATYHTKSPQTWRSQLDSRRGTGSLYPRARQSYAVSARSARSAGVAGVALAPEDPGVSGAALIAAAAAGAPPRTAREALGRLTGGGKMSLGR
jgi:hypothetical protein